MVNVDADHSALSTAWLADIANGSFLAHFVHVKGVQLILNGVSVSLNPTT